MIVRGVILCVGFVSIASFVACSDEFAASSSGTDSGVTADAGPGEAGAGDTGSRDAAACAVDCQGGACVSGVCQPVLLATGLNGPYGIAVRGDSIYVTEFVAHGRVLRLDKNGVVQTPEVLASEATLAAIVKIPTYVSQPFAIAANDSEVFWSDVGARAGSGFTKLFRVATSPNATIVPFYELCAQAGVAMSDLDVFWANQATPSCFRPEQNGVFRGSLAPNGGHSGSVYFPIGADGGAPMTPGAVGLDGNRVFVGAGNQMLIFDADKINDPNGVTNALLGGSSALSAAPYGVASDFGSVVWTDYQAGGNVYLLAKTSGPNTPPIVLATKQGGPLGIAIDNPGSFVYFTNYADGALMRVKKDGSGQAAVVLAGLTHPAFIASDATSLYFTIFGTGRGDGAVMRLAKP